MLGGWTLGFAMSQHAFDKKSGIFFGVASAKNDWFSCHLRASPGSKMDRNFVDWNLEIRKGFSAAGVLWTRYSLSQLLISLFESHTFLPHSPSFISTPYLLRVRPSLTHRACQLRVHGAFGPCKVAAWRWSATAQIHVLASKQPSAAFLRWQLHMF